DSRGYRPPWWLPDALNRDCVVAHVGDLDRRRWKRLGRPRGVDVAIRLSCQLADLVHHLVDELAVDDVVVAPRRIPGRIDRLAEGDRTRTKWLGQLGVGRLDVGRADDPDRVDRTAGADRQPRRAGVALVEGAV